MGKLVQEHVFGILPGEPAQKAYGHEQDRFEYTGYCWAEHLIGHQDPGSTL
jgi:hypothetical protein